MSAAHDSSAGGRLSRPRAEMLLDLFVDSLTDRLGSAEHGREGDGRARRRIRGRKALEQVPFFGGLRRRERRDLARHALDAALEVLDAEPALASELLPCTTSAVQARIAQGCVGECEVESLGYVIAEIDLRIWRQLLYTDQRSVPLDRLEPAEVEERRDAVLLELGVDRVDLLRFLKDRRVALAMTEFDTPGT